MRKPIKKNAAIVNGEYMVNEAVANAITTRAEIWKRLMDPKREINEECGYPDTLTVEMYKYLYDREGISTRIVNIFPEESWKKNPEVLETEDGEHTDWENAWKKLERRHRIYATLCKIDKLSGIGSFGLLFIGINDGKTPDKPVDGMDLKTGEPKEATKNAEEPERKLLFLRTFDESVVKILEYEKDTKNPRYGLPVMYSVQLADDMSTRGSQVNTTPPDQKEMKIHWTRALHVADNLGNSMVFGTPRMQDVFNRLFDTRKVLGGSGEMFWKGGFPGISFETQPQSAGVQVTELSKDDRRRLRRQIEAYQNGLQRYLSLFGMTAKSLAPQVADPSNHFETSVKAICISKGIPFRVFMGTEEGQLAGAQDKQAWNEVLIKRQVDYIEPCIVRPFIERLMAMGVVAFLEDYSVKFPDLNTKSDTDRSVIAVNTTKALANYITAGVDSLIPPLDYLTYIVGLPTDVAEAVLENALVAADGTLENPARVQDELDAEKESAEADRKLKAQAVPRDTKKVAINPGKTGRGGKRAPTPTSKAA